VAHSLIPFLENARREPRADGSNMQRQAVPLLRTRGRWWHRHRVDGPPRSGVCVVARRDARRPGGRARIVVRADVKESSHDVASEVDIYNLTKVQRSNQNTCINQKPIVSRATGWENDVIADATAPNGELALGQNVAVALHALAGYNFEDSILIQRAHRQGGRVHLDPHRGVRVHRARHQAGQEEITRDIPNVVKRRSKDWTTRASSASARRCSRAPSWWARSLQGRDPVSPEEKLPPRHLRRKGRRRPRQLAARPAECRAR